MSKFYTYIYFDPKDNTPIYVGAGTNKRAWKHNRSKIGCVIRKRIAQGYTIKPIIIPLPTKAEALQMEIFWIAYYGRADLGVGTLFNLTDGGKGSSGSKALTGRVQSPEEVEAHRVAAIRYWANNSISEETRKLQSAKSRASNARPEYRKAQSESMLAVWAKRKAKTN